MADYSVWIADAFGQAVTTADNFVVLDYTRSVNEVGVLSLTLPANFTTKAIGLDYRIGVWRKIGRYTYLDTETVFLLRSITDTTDDDGRELRVLTGLSALHLGKRRHVMYPSGSAQVRKTGPVDDLMKAVVRENLGSLAADPDRDWSRYLSVAADTGQGPEVSMSFAYANVLDVLADLSAAAAEAGTPVYYDIVSTGAMLEFRTYPGVRGTDRTRGSGESPLTLTTEGGTLANTTVTEDRVEEITFVYAGGRGEKENRVIMTASDPARIALSPFARCETFVDARNAEDPAEVQAEAAAALVAGRPLFHFEGDILSNEQAQYGIHWGFGDKCTAETRRRRANCAIDKVRVRVKDGEESITAELREVS